MKITATVGKIISRVRSSVSNLSVDWSGTAHCWTTYEMMNYLATATLSHVTHVTPGRLLACPNS